MYLFYSEYVFWSAQSGAFDIVLEYSYRTKNEAQGVNYRHHRVKLVSYRIKDGSIKSEHLDYHPIDSNVARGVSFVYQSLDQYFENYRGEPENVTFVLESSALESGIEINFTKFSTAHYVDRENRRCIRNTYVDEKDDLELPVITQAAVDISNCFPDPSWAEFSGIIPAREDLYFFNVYGTTGEI